MGITFASISFLYGAFLLVRTLISGNDVPGYASSTVIILFLGGIQLVSLGILGEYLGRIYEEVKGRPLYLVRDAYGAGRKPTIDRSRVLIETSPDLAGSVHKQPDPSQTSFSPAEENA